MGVKRVDLSASCPTQEPWREVRVAQGEGGGCEPGSEGGTSRLKGTTTSQVTEEPTRQTGSNPEG